MFKYTPPVAYYTQRIPDFTFVVHLVSYQGSVDTLMQDLDEWNEYGRGKKQSCLGVRQRAERMAEEAKEEDPDHFRLHIAWTLGSLMVVTRSNAVQLARQFDLPELALVGDLRIWSDDAPHDAASFVMRSKLGFCQTLHRRSETAWGVPRTLVNKKLRTNPSTTFIKVCVGKVVGSDGEEEDKVDYMQMRAVFTSHLDVAGKGPALGTVILGRWAERVPASRAMIPEVLCLEWKKVPLRKPKLNDGTDAFFQLIEGEAVMEACVVVPWFGDDAINWDRTMETANGLVVCAERLADSNKN
jgi:hypothetical protein